MTSSSPLEEQWKQMEARWLGNNRQEGWTVPNPPLLDSGMEKSPPDQGEPYYKILTLPVPLSAGVIPHHVAGVNTCL